MNALLALLPAVQSAWAVIGAFTGNAQAAKIDAAVQGAVTLISAATPLFQQFASGKEVTPDEVRTALSGFDTELAAFDRELAAREAAGT